MTAAETSSEAAVTVVVEVEHGHAAAPCRAGQYLHLVEDDPVRALVPHGDVLDIDHRERRPPRIDHFR